MPGDFPFGVALDAISRFAPFQLFWNAVYQADWVDFSPAVLGTTLAVDYTAGAGSMTLSGSTVTPAGQAPGIASTPNQNCMAVDTSAFLVNSFAKHSNAYQFRLTRISNPGLTAVYSVTGLTASGSNYTTNALTLVGGTDQNFPANDTRIDTGGYGFSSTFYQNTTHVGTYPTGLTSDLLPYPLGSGSLLSITLTGQFPYGLGYEGRGSLYHFVVDGQGTGTLQAGGHTPVGVGSTWSFNDGGVAGANVPLNADISNPATWNAMPQWAITVTSSNAANPVKNIRLIMPDHLGVSGLAAYAANPFRPGALQYLLPWHSLRSYTWISVNNSPVVNWADSGSGVAYTRYNPVTGSNWGPWIQLMNTLAARSSQFEETWIDIPHQATCEGDPGVATHTSYVYQLAQLIARTFTNANDPNSGLDRRVRVKFNYSNELWNGKFSQTTYAARRAGWANGTGAGFPGLNLSNNKTTIAGSSPIIPDSGTIPLTAIGAFGTGTYFPAAGTIYLRRLSDNLFQSYNYTGIGGSSLTGVTLQHGAANTTFQPGDEATDGSNANFITGSFQEAGEAGQLWNALRTKQIGDVLKSILVPAGFTVAMGLGASWSQIVTGQISTAWFAAQGRADAWDSIDVAPYLHINYNQANPGAWDYGLLMRPAATFDPSSQTTLTVNSTWGDGASKQAPQGNNVLTVTGTGANAGKSYELSYTGHTATSPYQFTGCSVVAGSLIGTTTAFAIHSTPDADITDDRAVLGGLMMLDPAQFSASYNSGTQTTTLTCGTFTPHELVAGDPIALQYITNTGITVAGTQMLANGTWAVASVPTPTTFTVNIPPQTDANGATIAGNVVTAGKMAAGNFQPALTRTPHAWPASYISFNAGTLTVKANVGTHNAAVGMQVAVLGNSSGGATSPFDGLWTVSAADGDSISWQVPAGTAGTPGPTGTGTWIHQVYVYDWAYYQALINGALTQLAQQYFPGQARAWVQLAGQYGKEARCYESGTSLTPLTTTGGINNNEFVNDLYNRMSYDSTQGPLYALAYSTLIGAGFSAANHTGWIEYPGQSLAPGGSNGTYGLWPFEGSPMASAVKPRALFDLMQRQQAVAVGGRTVVATVDPCPPIFP